MKSLADHVRELKEKKKGDRKKIDYVEQRHQRAVAAYLDCREPAPTWLHIPNERSNGFETMILVGLGLKKGAPDFMIFDPVVDFGSGVFEYSGVAIELKRPKGGIKTPEQIEWLAALARCGWFTKFCNGANEAFDVIDEMYGQQEWAYNSACLKLVSVSDVSKIVGERLACIRLK